ncbi:hypothetical protein [Dyadobacter crusticola]|uniref:hypothetical protein n=1 Tax=Dyadobacter crusticola TaxID=292407 RepID=UPI0012FA4E86|nr:hypothetical protein [Dyadobacter crusticola]
MMRTRVFGFVISIAALLCGCAENEEEAFCTEEFRSVTLLVPGDSLTKSYTVRLSTSDTIRYPQSPGFGGNHNVYVVLNDTYQPKLKGEVDNFRFIGERAGKVVISEDYVIKADHCHITKVSGKSEL